MRFDTLDQWLEWQTRLHDKAIDLGLDRVREVAGRLGIDRIAGRVITVAGTNGKGSSVAAYETWLQQAGFSVASYTSPHLLRYNERIRYNRNPANDSELCDAFAAVEAARGEVALTYFEYGTLAALHFMQQRQPDFAILEVGLGGRLDAVNIIDADLVHLTPIGLDHQAWLGNDRETIGAEKAGVLRDRIDVVINDADAPRSVLAAAAEHACNCRQLGQDYHVQILDDRRFLWSDCERELTLDNVVGGQHQAQNLAGVVAGLKLLLPLQDYSDEQLRRGFHGTRIAGRMQSLDSHLPARLYADVGHNEDAARVLAQSLKTMKTCGGRVIVLLGMLADKQPQAFVQMLADVVDEWWLLSTVSERGMTADQLAQRIGDQVRPARHFDSVEAALDHALSSLHKLDIMLVTGSFVTVELLLHALSDSGELPE